MLISWANPTQTTHFVEFPHHSRFAPQGQQGQRSGREENSSDQHDPPQILGEELQLQVQPEVLSVQILSCLSFPFDRGAHFLGQFILMSLQWKPGDISEDWGGQHSLNRCVQGTLSLYN